MSDISILVSSRNGNTKRVADAMAEELGVKSGDVKTSSLDDSKIVFLGSGTYGSKPGKDMMKFIDYNEFNGRRVALFGTSWSPTGSQKMLKVMELALKQKGATILGSYHCPGKFVLFNMDRPNKEDLDNAKTFAKEMTKSS
jgi:flavodoxin I